MNVAAIGQPGAVGVSTNAARVNYAGFLNAFLLAPERDLDADGVADENDPDDDGDGLADGTELRGDAFHPTTPSDPARADTDGDGMVDGAEAAAGTNPTDASNALRIVAVAVGDARVDVTWHSRQGVQYDLVAGDTASDVSTGGTVAAVVTATNGSGAWLEGETTGTDDTGGRARFYRVRLVQP